MIRLQRLVSRLAILPLAAVLAGPPQAFAQDGNPGTPIDEFKVGAITTYSSEAAALAACGAQAVVWAERYAGYFYRQDEAQYAAVPQGAFACRQDAMDANYWGTGVLDTMMKHHGKEMKWIYPSS